MNLRPYREDDFDELLSLMNDHQEKAFGERDYTADDLRRWLTTPYVEVENDLRILEADGRIVGYADVDPTRADPPVWWCDVKVDPDVDAEAALGKLAGWIDERSEAGRLYVWASATDTRMIDAFRGLGFEHSRHSYRMEIDLTAAPPAPAWPEGIAVETVERGAEEAVYDAVVEVWLDTSDPVSETFEEWAHWMLDESEYDPALWFLARDGDELAGFSICRQDTNDAAAGHVPLLGVRRPWRRKGLGEALLLHSFHAFRERGWTRGTLGVDVSNPTGPLRLYERAGMRAYRDTVFLNRPARA